MTKKDTGKTSKVKGKEDNTTIEEQLNEEVISEHNSEEHKGSNAKKSEDTSKKSAKTTSKSTKKSAAKKKTTTAKTDKTKEKLEEAEKKAEEWNDKYLRLSAEFDNYRRRTLKEKADLTKTANSSLLVDLLPVIDDFERGIDTVEKAQDVDALKEGLNLIYNKFKEFIKQKGIKEIEAKEKDFDIDYHEALTKIPAPSEELKGKVVDVIEKGYLLNDKVIRYAKVVIGE